MSRMAALQTPPSLPSVLQSYRPSPSSSPPGGAEAGGREGLVLLSQGGRRGRGRAGGREVAEADSPGTMFLENNLTSHAVRSHAFVFSYPFICVEKFSSDLLKFKTCHERSS